MPWFTVYFNSVLYNINIHESGIQINPHGSMAPVGVALSTGWYPEYSVQKVFWYEGDNIRPNSC